MAGKLQVDSCGTCMLARLASPRRQRLNLVRSAGDGGLACVEPRKRRLAAAAATGRAPRRGLPPAECA